MSEKRMAECSVGESFFSSDFFLPLLRRFFSREVSDFCRSLKVNKKTLKDIERNLLSHDAIFDDAFLDDAEVIAYENKDVKAWFDKLNEIACGLGDLLHKIDSTGKLKNRQDKLWNITILWSKSTSSEKVIKQLLKDIAEQVKDLEGRGEPLGLRNSVQINRKACQLSGGREYRFEDQVFGRDEDKEAIVELLLSDGVSAKHDHQTDVMTMVGTCGIGKTTLAQLVYNDERVKKHFDFKCWIYVSEEFDDLLLTKAILHAFSYHQSDSENRDSDEFDGLLTEASCQQSEIEDLDSLRTRLKESLIRKKFLIVLDNLSVGTDWRNLRKTLTAGVNGSKIIVTTRYSELQAISTIPAYTVRYLEDKESWMLFAKHAFPDKISTSLHPKVEAIKKEIMEKCCGLPMAAKLLGSVLHFKPVEEWHAVLDNVILWSEWNLSTNLLELSYNDLPIHLKRCVAYCSMFPKYHEFEEEKLIRLWMAEGFLQQKGDTRMEELGSEYFHDLIYRSFFQPSAASKSSFIMNDLLHDFAHSKSGFICSRMSNDEYSTVSRRPWHLLISGGNNAAEHCNSSSENKFLRTLILHKWTWDNESCQLSGEQLKNLFEALQHLRVLTLSHCAKLPDAIVKLKCLRFLDLSHNPITQLPPCVSSLSHLQTLLLSHCSRLTELSDSFQELKNLRFLDLSHTAITTLPDNVSSLVNLQILLLSQCSYLTRLPDSFQELNSLQCLDLSHTSFTSLPNSVGSLYKLQKLLLSHCSHLTELPDFIKLENLLLLDVSHTPINRLPDSVGSLYKLQKLLLSHCSHLTELPDFIELENLLLLDVSHTPITRLPDSVCSLYKLQKLSYCSRLTELPERIWTFQNLQFLDVSHVSSSYLNEDSSAKHGRASDNYSAATKISSDTNTDDQINLEERLDDSEESKRLLPESSKRPTEDSSSKHGGASDKCSDAIETSSDTKNDDPINLEESLDNIEASKTSDPESPKSSSPDDPVDFIEEERLEDVSCPEQESLNVSEISQLKRLPVKLRSIKIEESKSPPPESSKRPTEDSSSKHGGASDKCSDAIETSSDTKNDDPINLEESLDNIEASKTSHPESPKSSSAKRGDASDNGSAATEFSSDMDTDDPTDDIEEESLGDVSSPEQESLDVSEISQLKGLPLKLRSLKIEGCDALKSLHEKSLHDNPYLRHLYIIDCHFLKSIHGSHLPIALKTLYIHKCKKLEFLETMGEHTSLEDLCIESSCDSLMSFPLAFFPNLKNLSIRDCANFNSISIGLKDHLSLDALEIRDCAKLISFPEEGLRIPSLTSIVLSNCKNLKALPGRLHSLTSLQSLLINECPELESIPEGGLPSSLNLVSISSCYKLTPRIEWGLNQLESFSCIEIEGGCRGLESFPEQNLLPGNLTSLRISRLMNLKFLNNKGLQHLTSLETLKINSCNNLQSFPEEGLPSSLTCLYISDCPLLKSKLRNGRGKEWYKIAHIPHIQIDMEVIS